MSPSLCCQGMEVYNTEQAIILRLKFFPFLDSTKEVSKVDCASWLYPTEHTLKVGESTILSKPLVMCEVPYLWILLHSALGKPCTS